jgi:hypothetical protein
MGYLRSGLSSHVLAHEITLSIFQLRRYVKKCNAFGRNGFPLLLRFHTVPAASLSTSMANEEAAPPSDLPSSRSPALEFQV